MLQRIFLCLAVLAFVSGTVFAEVITLKTGKVVEGEIIERTAYYVKVNHRGLVSTYYLEDIKTISSNGASSTISSSSPTREVIVERPAVAGYDSFSEVCHYLCKRSEFCRCLATNMKNFRIPEPEAIAALRRMSADPEYMPDDENLAKSFESCAEIVDFDRPVGSISKPILGKKSPRPKSDLWIVEQVWVDINKMTSSSIIGSLPARIGQFQSDDKDVGHFGAGKTDRSYRSDYADIKISLSPFGYYKGSKTIFAPHGRVSPGLIELKNAQSQYFLGKSSLKLKDDREEQIALPDGSVFKYLFTSVPSADASKDTTFSMYYFSIQGFFIGEMEISAKGEHKQEIGRFVKDLFIALSVDKGEGLMLSIDKARRHLISVVHNKGESREERAKALFNLVMFPFSRTDQEREDVVRICEKIIGDKSSESADMVAMAEMVKTTLKKTIEK
jgi:hypothetical protein